MAKFKCNKSGNTVEFFQEHEITEMRRHKEYTEVVETVVVEKVVPAKTPSKKVIKDESSIDGAESNS